MQHTLLSSSFLSLSLGAFAQVPPDQEAPLIQHMQEVNAEWRSHQPAGLDLAQIAYFSNEAERIAFHLRLVEHSLEHEVPEGISGDQLQNRHELLGELVRYADQGRFPKNHVLPYRNPVFIDPAGTACAVGQLMIASGAVDLATRIDREMETAYIRDMHWPEIDAWASAHGFTAEELAWIQPGYAPPIPWIILGGGTDGSRVDELLRLENGDLIIAGDFFHAGNTVCSGVARWNGSDYIAMGTLPTGQVNTAIEFEGEIYLGGSFNDGAVDLLKWNNGTWEESTVFSSKYAELTALHVYNGALHAAGSRSGFAGIDHGVQRLSNGTWNQVGQVLNGQILSLETFEGGLVAGGAFTDEFLSQGNTIKHIARLNTTTWEQLGDGLDGTVCDMLISGADLYAGGDMVGEVNTYFGLARFDTGATEWTPLMPNISNYIYSPLDGLTRVNAMVEHDGRIFLGGNFYVNEFLNIGASLAVFNGTPDDVQPYAAFSGPVYDLDLIGDDQLVACGVINGFGNIATTDLTTGIGTSTALTVTMFPNPVAEQLTVQLPGGLSSGAPIRIIDASGRLVDPPIDRLGTYLRVDARALASGQYFIEVGGDALIAKGRFTKN